MVIDLIAHVGDTSNLILDPDLDSYYLMDVVVAKVPSLAEKMGVYRGTASGIAASGRMDEDTKINLINLASGVRSLSEATERSMQVAFQNNPGLESRLGSAIEGFAGASADFLAMVEADVVRASTITVASKDIFAAGTKAIGASLALYDQVSPVLIELLQIRIGGFQQGKLRSLGLVAVTVLFALGLALWTTRNITSSIRAAVSVTEAIASDDLTQSIHGDSRDELGKLLGALRGMQHSLAQRIRSIQESAQSVNGGAEEISQGNVNLSERTEQQASSLEETASSMEQMTSTVKQNADNARQANQLATGAREQAEKGGEVVSNAVAAMQEINVSSKKIADIIGVIDEIAFQTNLLALNAAVEAARAGEQGRGFAVVATEVRSLAQRSATAAKEIKALIQDSVTKVEDGSKLVDESGETLEGIVAAVKKVSDIIAEIAAASQEQSTGIEQVNRAITHMDEMTQQNAALVEEAAAASESMSDEARALNNLMSSFQLPNDTQSVVQSVPPATLPQPQSSERRSASRPWTDSQPTQAQPGQTQPTPTTQPARKMVAAGGGGDDEWEDF